MTKNQIIIILRNVDVPYFTSGKNVSKDAVNVKCPFCEDISNHLGILPDNYEVFSCWRCGRSGPFVYLLRTLTGYSEEACQEIIDETSEFSDCRDIHSVIKEINSNKEVEKREIRTTGLPKYFEPVTENMDYPLMYKYLERRKVSLETIIKHKCGVCRVGSYMNRLIFPIISNRNVVAFQAADMSGQSDLKYVSSDNLEGCFLYNYDNIRSERVVLVEGVLDCWRVEEVEPSVIASFTTKITDMQKSLIIERHPKELVIAFDNDAFWLARKIAYEFVPYIEKVRVVQFPAPPPKIDPDLYGRDLGASKLLELIEESNYLN